MDSQPLEFSSTRVTLDEAFDYCGRITNSHYENFPVASLFLPKDKRPFVQVIYAFSRMADDMADEQVRPVAERLADLDIWEDNLNRCYQGDAHHPVFIALADTVSRLDIPKELLLNLLTAFRRDVLQQRYETFEDLLSYCACSANPVGRIVLTIFGYRDEKLFLLSDKICTALQLTNFWQDVAIDRDKSRLYIPIDDCTSHGYSIEQWRNGRVDDNFQRLMKFETERTRDLFYGGAELPFIVDKDLQLELKLIWFGGMSILKKLERNKFDMFANRPALSSWDKMSILFRGLFSNNLRRPKKKGEPWDLTR